MYVCIFKYIHIHIYINTYIAVVVKGTPMHVQAYRTHVSCERKVLRLWMTHFSMLALERNMLNFTVHMHAQILELCTANKFWCTYFKLNFTVVCKCRKNIARTCICVNCTGIAYVTAPSLREGYSIRNGAFLTRRL